LNETKPSRGSGNAFDRLRSTYQYLLGGKADPGFNAADLSSKVRDTLVPPARREEMGKTLEYAAQLGLCIGKLSEASIFIQGNQFLATRRDCSFSNLMADDFLLVSPGIVSNQNLTPPYWSWQQSIYQSNSKARAVLLGQPLETMVLASRGELPVEDVLIDAAKKIGKIVSCPPDADQIGSAAKEANVIFIPGSGIVSWGDTLIDAVENLAIVNLWSGITNRARS
jgi:ribulose-5-phosphate 4-epimerase/fuculose-1-phosphate aldolase